MESLKKLDEIDYIKKVDKNGMLYLIEKFPEELNESLKNSRIINEKEDINDKEFSSILIGGLGGSAIVGDVISNWLQQRLKIPIYVWRDYHLPGFVHEKTISIIISYSGETEEALSLLYEAYRKNSTIFCIASGGKMENFCFKLKIPFIKIKPNLPPRVALPNLLGAMLFLFQKIKLVNDISIEIEDLLNGLNETRKRIGFSVPSNKNLIKELAFSLLGKIPIVYSINRYSSVAQRLKNQFNENSKVFSIASIIPEACHNEVEGLTYLKSNPLNCSFIFLRFNDEFLEESIRIEEMKNLLKELEFNNINEIKAIGKSSLGNLFSAIYQCDYLSVYLAILRNVDPSPIKYIDLLKARVSTKTKIKDFLEKVI
ncbi:MAG: bifunctional phosphoglucose/phosphomannose isomerase [Candidatus Bathyarchaeia archaeon]